MPIPAGRDLDEINRALLERLDAQADQERFTVEREHMLPVPAQPFAAHATQLSTVTRRSLVKVQGAVYSVPCASAGLDVAVRVGADTFEVVGRGEVIARHPRLRFGERSIDYRHYIPELKQKPQALRQVVSELVRDLGPPFDDAWRVLVDAHGARDAARVFAKVLGHVEARGVAAVAQTLQDALRRREPLLLALAPPAPPAPALSDSALPQTLRVEVPAGRAADYDVLLAGGAA